MSTVFSSRTIEISINDHVYNVHSAIIEKYFVIGVVEQERFVDVYNFVLEHENVAAPKHVSDKIVTALYLGIPSEAIKADTDNEAFYIKFIDAHLTVPIIDWGFKKVAYIKECIDELYNFMTDTKYELSEKNYAIVSDALASTITKLFSDDALVIKPRPYGTDNDSKFNRFTVDSKTINLAFYRSNLGATPYLFMMMNAGLNSFDELLLALGTTEEQVNSYGIDVSFYKNTKLIYDRRHVE